MCLKQISTIACIFVMFIFFNACENKDNSEVFWHITQCKDPWWVENVELTSSTYRDLMTEYLLTKNIVVSDHFLDENAEADDDSCVGCGCKTTNRIRTIILEADVEKAIAEGFTTE